MIRVRILLAGRWLAAAACLTAPAEARGFYFAGWPGDGLDRAPSLLGPVTPDPGDQPPGGVGDPGPGDRTSAPGRGGPLVPAVPEPGTLAMAAAGIVAVALARRRRRAGA
jgi:hypothetical protein